MATHYYNPDVNRDAQLKQAALWDELMQREMADYFDGLRFGQHVRDAFEMGIAQNLVMCSMNSQQPFIVASIPDHLLDPSIRRASRKP